MAIATSEVWTMLLLDDPAGSRLGVKGLDIIVVNIGIIGKVTNTSFFNWLFTNLYASNLAHFFRAFLERESLGVPHPQYLLDWL